MRYAAGSYRVNARYYEREFRSSGVVYPHLEVSGPAGSMQATVAVCGFLECRQAPGMAFDVFSVPKKKRVILRWRWQNRTEDPAEVRDLGGELVFDE